MGEGAGLTVCVAVFMARMFLPEILARSDWVLKTELRIQRDIRNCFCEQKCTADTADDENETDKKESKSISCYASWFYISAIVVSVVYILSVTASGAYVFARFGIERGIGFLPSLPRDMAETNALKSLEHQFGPGPVRHASTVTDAHNLCHYRYSPST